MPAMVLLFITDTIAVKAVGTASAANETNLFRG